jgi:NAD(P)H-hydrate repair Nnr-like enzyme with NAD(P)H-hydrate epimerase domain
MGRLGEREREREGSRGRNSERVIQCGGGEGEGGGVVCADCLDLLAAAATIMISFGRRRVRRRLARREASRRDAGSNCCVVTSVTNTLFGQVTADKTRYVWKG